jgi:hypothetical protein
MTGIPFHSSGKLPKHILQWLKDHGQNLTVKAGTRKRIHDGGIQAGEVILLSYPIVLKQVTRSSPNQLVMKKRSASIGGDYRIVFVVNTGGGRTGGVFLSTAGNYLLTAFKLSSSTVVNKIVLRAFYRKRSVQYQNFMHILGKIYGLDAFRTYNLAKARDLQVLKLDLRRIRENEEDDE